MSFRVMSHLVCHFPDREGCLETARALADGGSSYLELQFPFSDPVADGPAIQEACARALAEGFTVAEGLGVVEAIAARLPVPLFVMCYANTAYVNGVKSFVQRCARAGARGLIVPDLPVDRDEGLYGACRSHRVHAVPVVSPSVSDERLGLILRHASPYLYAALRRGTTGADTSLDRESLDFLRRVTAPPGGESRQGRGGPATPEHGAGTARRVRVLAGFGISSSGQVQELAGLVHAVVVGSAYVREILAAGRPDLYRAVRRKAEELTGNAGGAPCRASAP
jgi:tryptophan synthase alpha chain